MPRMFSLPWRCISCTSLCGMQVARIALFRAVFVAWNMVHSKTDQYRRYVRRLARVCTVLRGADVMHHSTRTRRPMRADAQTHTCHSAHAQGPCPSDGPSRTPCTQTALDGRMRIQNNGSACNAHACMCAHTRHTRTHRHTHAHTHRSSARMHTCATQRCACACVYACVCAHVQETRTCRRMNVRPPACTGTSARTRMHTCATKRCANACVHARVSCEHLTTSWSAPCSLPRVPHGRVQFAQPVHIIPLFWTSTNSRNHETACSNLSSGS